MPVVHVIFMVICRKNFLPPNIYIGCSSEISFISVLLADGNKFKGGVYMVFEYMDHDLTGLADRPGLRFTIPQIKV